MVMEVHVMKFLRSSFCADVAPWGILKNGSWVLRPRRNYFYTLCALGLANPCHGFMAELLLLLGISTSQQQHLQLTGAKLEVEEVWSRLENVSAWCSLDIPGFFQYVRESLHSRFYYPPPQLAAQPSVDSGGQGLLLLDGPKENKLAEVILRSEWERLRSPASHHISSGSCIAEGNQRHTDIWWRWSLKNPSCLRLLASQSHLKSFASFWRQLFVSANPEWTAGPISPNTPRLMNSETRWGNLDFL